VPFLVQLYLLSLLVVRVAKNRWKLVLFIAAFIQIVAKVLCYAYLFGIKLDVPFIPEWYLRQNWFFPLHAFWIAFGIVVGFHIEQFKVWLTKFKWLFVVSSIVFFAGGILEWELIFRYVDGWVAPRETIVSSLYAISVILAFLAFDKTIIPFSKQIGTLGGISFGIYLAHVPAQEYISRIIYHIAPALLGYQVLFLPIVFGAGLFIPIVLMKSVKKSPINNYYPYIFG
jgi:peptidoglycan/LPS O-acetylase OafA/YrhL